MSLVEEYEIKHYIEDSNEQDTDFIELKEVVEPQFPEHLEAGSNVPMAKRPLICVEVTTNVNEKFFRN